MTVLAVPAVPRRAVALVLSGPAEEHAPGVDVALVLAAAAHVPGLAPAADPLVPRVTLAHVRPWRVDTMRMRVGVAEVAQLCVGAALVDVGAVGVAVSGEAGFAVAGEGEEAVDAVGVWVAG